jgi:hypothetical protein
MRWDKFGWIKNAAELISTLDEKFGSDDFENDPSVSNLTKGEGYAILTPNGDVLPEGDLVFEKRIAAEQISEELDEGHTVGTSQAA